MKEVLYSSPLLGYQDESGSDSDSSTGHTRKRVQFCGCGETSGNCNTTTGKCQADRKLRKSHEFNATKIDRGDIPNGSDLFRQVLREIQTQDSEDEGQRASPKCSSPPLKSILKRR